MVAYTGTMETNQSPFYLYTVYRAMTQDEVRELIKRHGLEGPVGDFILKQFVEYYADNDWCSGEPDDHGRLCFGQSHQYVWEELADTMGFKVDYDMTEEDRDSVEVVYDLFFAE